MSIIIVDGSALLYRSYYAFANRQLKSSTGELTSVSFGFFTGLLRLIADYNPEYLTVVFDVKGKNFRHKIYEEYKANRKPMPDDLRSQIPQLRELLELWGLAVYEEAGYEADDVIATIAEDLSEKHKVWMYSGDKDFMQLLKPGLTMLKPVKNNKIIEFSHESVLAEYGLEPEQLIDVFALAGDSSDNIPGAPGVGPKTAIKLIQENNSLDELYQNINTISTTPRIKNILSENEEQVRTSKQLFVIDKFVPVKYNLSEMKTILPIGKGVMGKLSQLDLRNVIAQITRLAQKSGSELPDLSSADIEVEKLDDVRILNDKNKLSQFLSELHDIQEVVVFPIADGAGNSNSVLAGLAIYGNNCAGYIPFLEYSSEAQATLFDDGPKDNLEWIKPLLVPFLSSDSLKKIIHNVKDALWLLDGLEIILDDNTADTMLGSYLLQYVDADYSIDHIASECFGYELPKFKLGNKGVSAYSLDDITAYACHAAWSVMRLHKLIQKDLPSNPSLNKLLSEMEIPVSSMLYTMEKNGIKLDTEYIKELKTVFSEKISQLEKAIYDTAEEEFNINSSKQLAEILFNKFNLKPIKKIATGWSTDSTVLAALASNHKLPSLVLEYRGLAKLLTTYVEGLKSQVNEKTGLIYTSFNQSVTATGRLSSSNPNLQNIPIRSDNGKLIRRAFTPRNNNNIFLSADYSQVELRLLAHLSKDEMLIETFSDGGDVHRRTAALIAGVAEGEVTSKMRSRAKAINFGVIYGMGARALAKQIGVTTREATGFIDDYFRTYPGVKQFIDDTKEQARIDKFVTTLFGRIRKLPNIISSSPRDRSYQERIAVNTPIQGSAADLIKMAMLAVNESINTSCPEAMVLLQVHDELLIELPASAKDEVTELVKTTMENVVELSVPLVVDVHTGANWAEAHD